MGTAIHAGMAEFWRNGRGKCADAVLGAFAKEWPIEAPIEFSREGLEELAVKVCKKTVAWCETNMADAKVLMVEEALGEDGHTTPDLVTEENGEVIITDWKYSHQVQPENIHYRLEGSERNHQFRHYAWAVAQKLGRSVSRFRKMVLIGLPTIKVAEDIFEITEEAQEAWLVQANAKWAAMVEMKSFPQWVYRREDGCMPFGEKYPCSMYEACWSCHGDENLMAQFYTREASNES